VARRPVSDGLNRLRWVVAIERWEDPKPNDKMQGKESDRNAYFEHLVVFAVD
jgi:hypothetical protein